MNLLPSDEQLEIVAAAKEFLADRLPVDRIRAEREAPSAVGAELWREGAELGLLTLGLPEDFGGSGQPFDDEVLLHIELGRRLAPGPFLAATLAARVAGECGAVELASEIGSGAVTVALAVLREGDSTDPAELLKGVFDVFDPIGARYALVVSREGAALVDIVAFGELTLAPSADPGTRFAPASLSGTEPLFWLPSEQDWIWGRAMVLCAAHLTGLALAAAADATEHARTREQFGKPIGANQAIKHSCVDMAVAAEAAQAQTFFAAITLASERDDALRQILAAITVAGTAAVDNAAKGIQVFGGMGYTFESAMHLYLKRAHVLHHLFGEPNSVLAELISLERGL
ncbi:hypothetical protein BH10ACT9_BH10ACT9_05830 [soil metagenome]